MTTTMLPQQACMPQGNSRLQPVKLLKKKTLSESQTTLQAYNIPTVTQQGATIHVILAKPFKEKTLSKSQTMMQACSVATPMQQETKTRYSCLIAQGKDPQRDVNFASRLEGCNRQQVGDKETRHLRCRGDIGAVLPHHCPHRPGTVAPEEILRYQGSTDLLLQKRPFKR